MPWSYSLFTSPDNAPRVRGNLIHCPACLPYVTLEVSLVSLDISELGYVSMDHIRVRRIEELAQEVAREVRSIRLAGFAIRPVERTPDALVVQCSWRLPIYIEVTITIRDRDTDETIKAEIRRQLLTT